MPINTGRGRFSWQTGSGIDIDTVFANPSSIVRLIGCCGNLPRPLSWGKILAIMPQLQLPIFYDGINPITNDIGYEKRDGSIVYYCGTMPIFSHQENDLDSFRTITCQFYVNGSAGQAQIARAFGIREQALKRWVKRYREEGPKTFYQPRRTRGKPTVLTPEVRARVQLLLDTGNSMSDSAKELSIGYDTVRKAVADGRLVIQKKRRR